MNALEITEQDGKIDIVLNGVPIYGVYSFKLTMGSPDDCPTLELKCGVFKLSRIET